MFDTILNFLSLGLKPVYEKHLEHYKIIKEFRDKLPRQQQQNEARKIGEEEKANNPFLSSLKYMTVVDLSTQKVSISEADIDILVVVQKV